MTFGSHIRQLREQNLLTARELASWVGIHFSSISHIEHGRLIPSDEVIRCLAQELHEDVQPLLDLAHQEKQEQQRARHPLVAQLIRILNSQSFSEEIYHKMLYLTRNEEQS